MKRELFDADQELFRESVAEFLRREVLPRHDRWEEDGDPFRVLLGADQELPGFR